MAIIGGAAALYQLSNMLGASFAVNTSLPLEIAWESGDPSEDWLLVPATIIDNVLYTNLSPIDYTNVIITITMTAPVGCVVQKWNIFFGAAVTWTHVDNIFTATKTLPNILADESGSWTFQLELFADAPDGTYTLEFYISGDPL